MTKIVRTYQQNFISVVSANNWDFLFANIPHKAKPSNRFKVSLSFLSMRQSNTTGASVLNPHAIWAKGLARSVSNTSASNVSTGQVSGDTLLGIVGNAYDVNVITALTTKTGYTEIGTPYYYYLDEIPTTPFHIYYTDITTYVYSSGSAGINILLSFLIEEEEV